MLFALLLACSPGPTPVAEPGPPPPAPSSPTPTPLWDLVDAAVSEQYGANGMGMASQDPAKAVRFVSLHRRDDHVVYVTHGVCDEPIPHEFVLRIRHAAASSERPLIEVAPMWPVHLLTELAETERRLGRPIPPHDYLRGVTLPGMELPYQGFGFMLDPVLKPIEDAGRYLAFVQVLPFTDAEITAMDAIPEGETNTVLKARLEPDPLGLVEG